MRPRPPKLDLLHRELDEIEARIGRKRPPVVVIIGGLPAGECRPHCSVRYPGGYIWHRVADPGESESAFLHRVHVEAELRGGFVACVGGLPEEPREDSDEGETWCRVDG